jgi:hypothetical protein
MAVAQITLEQYVEFGNGEIHIHDSLFLSGGLQKGHEEVRMSQ